MINKDTYKRFTELKTYNNGKKMYVQYSVSGCYNDMNRKGDYTTGDSVDRLAELEDKIENGTLIELPCNCKIGDLVYGVADFLSEPKLGILTCVEITKYCIQYGIVDKRLMRHDVRYVYYPAEKEAAEAKLKELQEKK